MYMCELEFGGAASPIYTWVCAHPSLIMRLWEDAKGFEYATVGRLGWAVEQGEGDAGACWAAAEAADSERRRRSQIGVADFYSRVRRAHHFAMS